MVESTNLANAQAIARNVTPKVAGATTPISSCNTAAGASTQRREVKTRCYRARIARLARSGLISLVQSTVDSRQTTDARRQLPPKNLSSLISYDIFIFASIVHRRNKAQSISQS